jgi:hypothetical protein
MNEDLCEHFLSHIPLKITEENNSELNNPITKEEIFATINQFNPNKSLVINDFTIYFYKRCWSIIKLISSG